MQFNSIAFLFYFLPVFLAVYYLVPAWLRNPALLMGSLVFYGINVSWDPVSFILLLVITLGTWLVGKALQHPGLRMTFWASIVMMAVLLVFFKCYSGGQYLPAGMSFYLFQMVAYLVAVYTQKLPAEQSLLSYSTGVLMFPKILSGPLVDPATLSSQVRKRPLDLKSFHNGLQLLILGMAMKVILANRIGGLWNQADVVGYESISPIFAWMSLLAYAMKLYFDFFGYSLMAVGIGRMMGFRLPHNFLDPYASKSISEFYRRWHITLGAWFRENIYIPMGGNRKGTVSTLVNLLVVWALTGLWHGVGGNYLLWAGILVAFIILEKLWLGKYLKKSHVLCHVYTVVVILLSWVPFAIGDWDKMAVFFGRLVGLGGQALNPTDYIYWFGKYAFLLLSGVVLMTPLPRKLWKWLEDSVIADVICFVLFWICVYFIATAAQDPFMYGQY